MNEKAVLLLIEDKQDASFKEKVEEHIDLNVRQAKQPKVIMDLHSFGKGKKKIKSGRVFYENFGTKPESLKKPLTTSLNFILNLIAE